MALGAPAQPLLQLSGSAFWCLGGRNVSLGLFFLAGQTQGDQLVHREVHIGKDADAGRDWGQEAKGTTEDETAGWHH